jgi:hypothetical protein
VLAVLTSIFRKVREHGIRVAAGELNCQPGALFFYDQDRLINVMVFDVVEGAVAAVRSVINPDKLHHLGPVSELARLPPRGS